MKAISQAAQSIALGDADIVIAGGMESMSNVPFYSEHMRWGNKYGNVSMIDGLAKDGLTDVYDGKAMGNAAELCAKECGISREAQDSFAIESYKRSQAAWKKGCLIRRLYQSKFPNGKEIRLFFQKMKNRSM
jgi:acetyl-CoA C-acetyltransferase